MENIVARNYPVLVLGAALLAAPAVSAWACQLSLKPETTGFFLNPTLQKVSVVKAVSGADKPCTLLVGDELLQVNDRMIPGAKARDVMAYWKGLPKGSNPTFKVRRAGTVLTVASK